MDAILESILVMSGMLFYLLIVVGAFLQLDHI